MRYVACARLGSPVRLSCAAWCASARRATSRSSFAVWIWSSESFIRAMTRPNTATEPATTAHTSSRTPSAACTPSTAGGTSAARPRVTSRARVNRTGSGLARPVSATIEGCSAAAPQVA